jgi:threonine aldolase
MIDFGSDTVSARMLAMPRAAADAPVGDDFYGDDPSVLAREHRTPELLGKNDAVYIVSGAAINQVREAA